MQKKSKNIKEIFSGEEIILTDIWALFWSKRKYLFISIIVFVLIGFIQSATTPKEFTARCVLLGEEGGGGGGGTALALAGLAGITGGNTGGGVTDLYPIVLANRPFLVELSKDSINLNDQTRITLMDYFQIPAKVDAITNAKTNLLNLPTTVRGWFRSSSPIQKNVPALPPVKKAEAVMPLTDTLLTLSRDSVKIIKARTKKLLDVITLSGQEMQIATILKSRIKLEQLGRQIIISVRMPESRLSAEATKLILNKLIEYITRYKTGKQLENLRFLEAIASDANIKYKKDQLKVAGFSDNNYGVIYESVKTKQQQLQNEYSITFNTYNQLAAQLEQARIDLKKQTPLFTVLEPVYIPLSPDAVTGVQVISINAALGAVIGMILIFGLLIKQYLSEKKVLSK